MSTFDLKCYDSNNKDEDKNLYVNSVNKIYNNKQN